jgi:hypothetical protein
MSEEDQREEEDETDEVVKGWDRDFALESQAPVPTPGPRTQAGSTSSLDMVINRVAWVEPNCPKDQIWKARLEAREFYIQLDPKDVEEESLCCQLVMFFSASAGMMRIANTFALKPEAAKAYFEMAVKASNMYMRLQQQLDRRRGRFTQRVVVQRVNVEQGGQAIVGAITTNNSRSLAAPAANDPAASRPLGIKYSTRPREEEAAANDAAVPPRRQRRPV